MSLASFVARFEPFARTCGVQVRLVARVPIMMSSPFENYLAIDWRGRSILYSNRLTEPGGMIHELGHLVWNRPQAIREGFVSKLSGPEEYEWMGWEYAVAIKCEVVDEWVDSMGGYVVGDGAHEFGCLNASHRASILRERTRVALKNGMLGPDGEPATRPVGRCSR